MIARLSAIAPARPDTQAGNNSPYHAQLQRIGTALADLANMQRQQALVLKITAPDSCLVTATVPVPELPPHWPTVPEPNWVTLKYDDSRLPFPRNTQLLYWLYDDNGELLYEGNDLTPRQPKRFLLPDGVEQVSYHFAVPNKVVQPPDMTDLFTTVGERIIHWYDVGPL